MQQCIANDGNGVKKIHSLPIYFTLYSWEVRDSEDFTDILYEPTGMWG
jgi:hypothetical protein